MDYHFKPIGKQCAATGQDLAPGTLCHSILVERNGEMTRLDYSPEGWTGPPADAIGYWQCRVPEPLATKPAAIDPDALLRYFEQLVEDAVPAREKFRYVLALLLLQKRRLRIDGSRRDGDAEYLQLSGSHGEGPFEVRDHQLSDDEIRNLEAELSTHLANEWS